MPLLQISLQVRVKLAILSCQPTAQWPGKTRLEFWLGLGGRGSPKQYLKWGWKLIMVKIIVCKLSGPCPLFLVVCSPFQWPSGSRGHKVWSSSRRLCICMCVCAVVLQWVSGSPSPLPAGLWGSWQVLGLTWDYFYIFLTRSALVFGSLSKLPS